MPRKSRPVVILGVDSLSVAERVLLFCIASDTDPIEAGASSATHVMILKNLLERDQRGHLVITEFGCLVLRSLIRLRGSGAISLTEYWRPPGLRTPPRTRRDGSIARIGPETPSQSLQAKTFAVAGS